MSNDNLQPLILVTSMESKYKLSKLRYVHIIFFHTSLLDLPSIPEIVVGTSHSY